MPINAIKDFLKMEAAGGIILLFTAVAALLFVNSPLAPYYIGFIEAPVMIQVGGLLIQKNLLLWVNDGLMAIFFLLIGLEIKREVIEGELSSAKKASLPLIAAIGGMLVPALVYYFINQQNPENLNGWAIPAATDIAFALGVLSLLKNRVPSSLKIFLLAIAMIDDLGAIMIIALFYTSKLSMLSLMLAGVGTAGLIILNRLNVRSTTPYILIGVFLWVCVLKSGMHATLAGVVVALCIPIRIKHSKDSFSPLKHLEHTLLPWVAFGIMPAFAFVNAGVPLDGTTLKSLMDPLPLGIAAGLFFGKQIGVFGFSYVAIKLGLSKPAGTNWMHLWGLSLLTGIGFTMSLFIGSLAFDSSDLGVKVRIGVLLGSFFAAITGFLILRFFSSTSKPKTQT